MRVVVVMSALAEPAKAIIKGNRVYRNYDRSKRRYRRTGSRTIVRVTIKPGLPAVVLFVRLSPAGPSTSRWIKIDAQQYSIYAILCYLSIYSLCPSDRFRTMDRQSGAFDRSEQRGACARVYVERRRLHTQACRIQQTFVKVQSFHKELTQHGSPLLEAALLDTFW